MSIIRCLREALENGEVVRVIRRPKRSLPNWEGFVVGLSNQFVVLHDMFPDYLALNGYTCIRLSDINQIEMIGASDRFVGRAVPLRGIERSIPVGIDPKNVVSLLRTGSERFPLVTVHIERIWPNVCYIGRLLKVGTKRVTVRTIHPDASWDTIEKLKLNDITMIQFDGGYERMLWAVNQAFHNTLLADAPEVGNA